MTEYDLPLAARQPYTWGNADTPGHLPAAAADALAVLGAVPTDPPVPAKDAHVPDTALPATATAELAAMLGANRLTCEHAARVEHTRGYSTTDLLTLRGGDASDAPDAVVFPGSTEDVVAVLDICSRHRIAVVPYAGGTSVVGGLTPARDGFAGVLAMDLRRLNRLVHIDAVSRTAVLQAGMRGVTAEQLLGERGYTLGHFPQSYEMATIGGYAAARSAGQSSAGYGRFDEMVVGLTLATARGPLSLGAAPMSSAGPDLRQLVLGSEGAFGVITSVTARIRPTPAARVFEGWRFDSFAEGATALRALAQDGPLPTVLRLSDEAETAINLADPGAAGSAGAGGCLAVVGYEGTEEWVAATRADATKRLLEHGGTQQGEPAGERWRTGRFRGPYLRDPLLDAGVLVETMETATFWSGLPALKAAVTEAVQGALGVPGLVMCHISHVYETGASLYFTVVAKQTEDPVRQWRRAKTAALAAIDEHGAAVSHHHGVGTDHRAALEQQLGPIGTDLLRAIKASLDPAGVLNPGVLIG
ncbi:MAG TPA: FAD-binding oxidoreductase [Pseudonocardiaceae bacterium]|nr:FAD-binding oxidoreductase [Pseudonocardiaceae bacterium]